jgi:hypothetical protein
MDRLQKRDRFIAPGHIPQPICSTGTGGKGKGERRRGKGERRACHPGPVQYIPQREDFTRTPRQYFVHLSSRQLRGSASSIFL